MKDVKEYSGYPYNLIRNAVSKYSETERYKDLSALPYTKEQLETIIEQQVFWRYKEKSKYIVLKYWKSNGAVTIAMLSEEVGQKQSTVNATISQASRSLSQCLDMLFLGLFDVDARGEYLRGTSPQSETMKTLLHTGAISMAQVRMLSIHSMGLSRGMVGKLVSYNIGTVGDLLDRLYGLQSLPGFGPCRVKALQKGIEGLHLDYNKVYRECVERRNKRIVHKLVADDWGIRNVDCLGLELFTEVLLDRNNVYRIIDLYNRRSYVSTMPGVTGDMVSDINRCLKNCNAGFSVQ